MESLVLKYLDKRYKIEGNKIYRNDVDGDDDNVVLWIIQAFGDAYIHLYRVWIKKRVGVVYCIVHGNGTEIWYLHTKIHRDKGRPAVINAAGKKMWFKKGEIHRLNDKPAIEYPNGDKEWFRNGQRHRDKYEPAVIRKGERDTYWHNGHEFLAPPRTKNDIY